MKSALIALSLTIAAAAPTWAQVGVVNPNVPVTVTAPPPAGSPPGTPPATRPSLPFTNEPNQLNNPHPMLRHARGSEAGGWGVPIRRIYGAADRGPIV